MCREIIEHIYPHLQNGSIKPIIDRVFELDEVASAHDHMQSGAHMGKIILRT
jgi:NADPH:quinone reductase-like Zn-dependent oxidoreductase